MNHELNSELEEISSKIEGNLESKLFPKMYKILGALSIILIGMGGWNTYYIAQIGGKVDQHDIALRKSEEVRDIVLKMNESLIYLAARTDKTNSLVIDFGLEQAKRGPRIMNLEKEFERRYKQ